MDKKELSEEFLAHLTKDIIPFWDALRDEENGGFYGTVDFEHRLDKKAEKGCILNSRILWFFSSAYMLLEELGDAAKEGGNISGKQAEGVAAGLSDYKELKETCLRNATHAYEFLKSAFLDKENGGVFWAVDHEGRPSDTLKHTYCHAFAIYALAAYFDASGEQEAFDLAMTLADLIEEKCTDDVGYLEAFNRDWTPALNDELSENGVMAEKTMNTLLHVFEAYTELLRVIRKRFPAIGGKKPGYSRENAAMAEKIANRMKFILDIFTEKIYNPKLRRQEVFFDAEYSPIIDLHSYGHDIESSWLIDRGLQILADVDYSNEVEPLTLSLAERIYERAYVDHSLLNECEKGVDNRKRVWRVQAEAVIGFMHAYSKIERKKDKVNINLKAAGMSAKDRQQTAVEAERRAANFFIASVDVWEFIKDHVIDRRTVPSEWYNELDADLVPIPTMEIVKSWKCPYHNGRMCIEMIKETIV